MRETNIQFLWKMARESAAKIQELEKRIAELEKQPEKKKPGRPRKTA